MQEIGKMLFVIGLVAAVVGLVLWKVGSFGPIGRPPGDISVQRPGMSFYFPIILTLLMWLFRR